MAMDSAGNIAMGYSLCSAGMYAGMAFTGRLAQDPPDIMTQEETIVKQGQGYQTVNRWGDHYYVVVYGWYEGTDTDVITAVSPPTR
jgi:hypothetical protein